MPVSVRIPTPLQKLTQNQAIVEASGANIKELIEDLNDKFPGLKERLCDETGKVRRFINIYVNDEDIRFIKLDKTQLKDGDKVSIIPAIAGGGDIFSPPKGAGHLYPDIFAKAYKCPVPQEHKSVPATELCEGLT